MSYVVLARRYRPQQFADLAGQAHVANTLKNAVAQSRFAHAYLFTGPRGVGKTSAARILAKAIRCLNPQDGEPCNTCEACVSTNEGKSMDVIEIDAASNTGVDNIRELRENVEYMASVGKYRVYIIDEVHMLSTAAFNALLKTLEEPPPHVIFIFATTELHKVLPTIQSRCQRFDFRRIPFDEMIQNLTEICKKEKVSIDEASLKTIAIESEGCLRDAQSLLDQAIAFCDGKITIEVLETALGLVGRHAYFKLFSQVLARDTATALQSVHNMLIQGNDPKILLNRTTQFYRDLHFAYFAKQMPKDDPELKELLEAYCSQWSTDEVVRALDICLRHQSQLYGASFSNYLVESLIVKLTLQRPLLANAGVFQAAPAAVLPQGASAAHNNSQREQNLAPSPTSPARPRHAESTSSGSISPSVTHPQELRSTFERYLRQHKPAWMPVLQSIQSFEMPSSDTVIVRAKADFAGRRLSSDDGIELIKKSLGVRAATVELSGSAPSQGPTNTDTALQEDAYQKMREVRDLAREHDGVQAAVRIFDAKITETKLLINDTKRKGDNK
jgi:DNA polymerase-3 subunit gamma/tau